MVRVDPDRAWRRTRGLLGDALARALGGRVYAFYTYNAEDLREVPNTNSAGVAKRVDTLGEYAFKYSDDGGRTWSEDRHYVPMRLMRIDRENNVSGDFPFFWGVGKPILQDDTMYLGFAKVGKWGVPGGMVISQGCFLKSSNITTETDPEKLRFELLPDGDEGLRAPKGPVSDEANLVALADGSLYATYRTIDGYPCAAYSRDGGHTWTPSAYMTYAPDGRRVKHPRAANFVKKFSNGKYLYWFHNHGGEPVHREAWSYYEGRNPAWISGGVEIDGHIHWSRARDPALRQGPGRPHQLSRLHRGRRAATSSPRRKRPSHASTRSTRPCWKAPGTSSPTPSGPTRASSPRPAGDPIPPDSTVPLPGMPDLSAGGGFTIDLWVKFDELSPGQTLLDAHDADGRTLALATTNRFTVELILNDGTTEARFDSDPGTGPGTLRVGDWQHIVAIVDGGPRIITFVVDGVLNDGGAVRAVRLGPVPARDRRPLGATSLRLAHKLYGQLRSVRVYDRYLRTSEAVGNHRAGLPDAADR